jgi:phosphoserine phosphatase RsbU/P
MVGTAARIGVVTGWIANGYSQGVVAGIRTTALARGASVVCFAGQSPTGRSAWDVAVNHVYEAITPDTVDGLVVLASSTLDDPDDLGRVARQFARLPLISVGVACPDVPAVLLDNEHGVAAEMDHLVTQHGCRTIAFLGGPEANREAEARYAAYRIGLIRHQLPLESRLVARGQLAEFAGRETMETVLLRVGKIDAVVASNDAMALGAIRALTSRGLLVPRDVAVVGFDDDTSAEDSPVPLTTVHQPIAQLGEAAADNLLDWLAGGKRPADEVLPTEVVFRQSCGCLPSVRSSRIGIVREGDVPKPEELLAHLEPFGVPDLEQFGSLLTDLCEDIKKGVAGQSLHGVAQLAMDFGRSAEALASWRNVLHRLRDSVRPDLARKGRDVLDDFVYNGQHVITDALVRAERHACAGRTERLESLIGLSSGIANVDDTDSLVDALDAGLVGLGIRGGDLAWIDPEAPAGARIVLRRVGGKRAKLPEDGIRTSWPRFIADCVSARRGPTFLTVVPLVVGARFQGMLVLEGSPEEWSSYLPIAQHTAATLERIALAAR